jgi:hypothetical protein
MSYTLDNTDLWLQYGIKGGQAPDSNIAVKGVFDMPQRLGETFYDWGDENGIEPYVADVDIIFGGRDVVFYGIILGAREEVNVKLQQLYTQVKSFTDLVVLGTPYGSFDVTVRSVIPTYKPGICSFEMLCREPYVKAYLFNFILKDTNDDFMIDNQGNRIVLNGWQPLPGTGVSPYTIDGIPFASLGLSLNEATDLHNLGDFKDQFVTKYAGEAYQLVKRQGNRLVFNGYLIGSTLNDFTTKAKWIQTLFIKPGLRTIKIRDEVVLECFATDGFEITGTYLYETAMIARFNASLMISSTSYI